jgi:hypothetical protein
MSAIIIRFPTRVVIDILKIELNNGRPLPHWLSPWWRVDRAAIRQKHREQAWRSSRAEGIAATLYDRCYRCTEKDRNTDVLEFEDR